MNLFILSPILAAVLNLALVFWIFSGAAPGPVRRIFLLWNLWLGLWNGGVAAAYMVNDAQSAFALYRVISSVVVRFLAPLFLHFVFAYTHVENKPKNRRILYVVYGLAFVFAGVGYWTPFLMSYPKHYAWGYYPLAGKFEWTYGLFYTATVAYAFRCLWRALQNAQGKRRSQIKSLLAGMTLCFVGGMTNFLPLYGIGIYPLGNLMNSFYSLVVAYTITEYELLNIEIFLRKSVVYGLLSGVLTLVYISFVGVLQKIFGHYGGQENLAFYTAAFPITVILAPTMKSTIEPFVNRTFSGSLLGPPPSSPALNNHDLSVMAMMATEMAHELSKPLTHIMNEGVRLSGMANAQSQVSLTRIGKEAQRAAEILDGFALLSPHRVLHKIPSQLAELLDEAMQSLGLEEDSSIHVIRRYGNFPPMNVNPGQMVQIFTNVIQNAWQAMGQGGTLILSVEEETNTRTMKINRVIVIEDSGSGIAAAAFDKLFVPFFTTKRSRGGRGVGLSITKAMVERHDGKIEIKSPITAEGGTRVRITLPIHEREI